MEQRRIRPSRDYRELDGWLRETGAERLFLVCGSSLGKWRLGGYFDTLEERLGIQVVRFSGFRPNPRYEEATAATAAFRAAGCQALAAVGGGSALDVAKCVKLWAELDPAGDCLERAVRPNAIPFLAVPTTAGTGSEATRYAVVYRRGEKQSIAHPGCVPSAVLLDPAALESLPDYHRKASMLDALCHGIESFWSVRAGEESRSLSRQAVRAVWEHLDGYLLNTPPGNAGMLEAANLAGRAIDLTQTTAGHAMCYKLTTLYGTAHGHGAALCVAALWPHMAERAAGTPLEAVLLRLAEAMGCETVEASVARFQALLRRLELKRPAARPEDFAVLRTSVNPVRLKNHPLPLTGEEIDWLYHQILSEEAAR